MTQLRYLAILQLKKPGEVYAGTAKGRHRKTESAPARRRRRHKALVAKRSATVGHEGSLKASLRQVAAKHPDKIELAF